MGKKKRHHYFTKEEKEVRAKENALERLNTLKSKLGEKNIDECTVTFFDIMHEFFADYCNVRYEFTDAELVNEIKKKKSFSKFVRDKAIDFLSKIQNKEFSGTHFSKEELNQHINRLRMIVKSSKTTEENPKLIEKWLSVRDRLKFMLYNTNTRFAKKEIDNIISLLAVIEENIKEDNIQEAQYAYKEIERIYDMLSPDEQKAVYESIKKAYKKIEESRANLIMARMERLYEEFQKEFNRSELDKASNIYNEIEELYEKIPKKNMKRIFSEVKALHEQLVKKVNKSKATDIKRFASITLKNIKEKKLKQAKKVYDQAHELYENLPQEFQEKTYPSLKKAYEAITKY